MGEPVGMNGPARTEWWPVATQKTGVRQCRIQAFQRYDEYEEVTSNFISVYLMIANDILLSQLGHNKFLLDLLPPSLNCVGSASILNYLRL